MYVAATVPPSSEMILALGNCEACGVQATQLQPDLVRRGVERTVTDAALHRFCDRHEFSDLLRTTTF